MRSLYKRSVGFLGSKTFFGIIMAILLFGSLWYAVSARYPMAFDEEYHIGLIKLHAKQWGPLFTTQPEGFAQYGALTTDPSYLFHYLMSFPYRLLTAMKLSDMQVIMVLRYMNVVMFAISIVMMRKLLLKTKASPAIIHVSLLFFVLLPVVPFLAATINYDNLQNILFVGGALFLLQFRAKLQKKSFDFKAFVGFMSIGLLASLVKFTFLPFLTAFAAYLLYVVVRYIIEHKKSFMKIVKRDWRALGRLRQVFLTLLFVLSCGLFLNSYAVNIVKYQNPIPQCGQVVGYERCKAYSPWYRNWQAAINNKPVNPNPVFYTGQWLGGMYNRLLFVINGKAPVDNYQNFMAPILALAAALLAIVGTILSFRFGNRIMQADPVLTILLFVSLVYVASVWGRNYHDWLHLKQAVAINGRYLIPVLPIVFVVVAQSFQLFLRGREKAKAWLFSISLLMFLQGGSVSSFIYYSSDSWYWDNNKQVQGLNHGAKKIISPFFITHYFTALDHLYQ